MIPTCAICMIIKENNWGDWGIMFNNINDNNLLNLNTTNNVINLANVRTVVKKNGYGTIPLVDKTEISSDAMKLFQKDLDIQKFAKIAAENPEDLSYLEQIQELFASGVVDPFEEDVLNKLVTNSKLWDDLNQ